MSTRGHSSTDVCQKSDSCSQQGLCNHITNKWNTTLGRPNSGLLLKRMHSMEFLSTLQKKKKKKVGGSISLLFSNFFFFLFKLPTFGRVHVANCAFSLAGVKDKVSAFTSNCLALHQHHHKCDI